MNISFSNVINKTNFKGNYTDKYFDNPEDFREDHRLIKEYEDLPEESNEDTIIINDMLREDELFDRKRDNVDSEYRRYDIYDVPLADSIIYRNINKDLCNISKFIESGHSNSRGCSWNLIPGSQIYTVENGYEKEHESFQERLNQGYKRSDISNIYHCSLIDTGTEGLKRMDFKLAKAGFKLLDRGKSIYQTVDIMDKSKIHYADGSSIFNAPLLEFLTDYPEARDCVVEGENNHEKVRYDIISIYGELDEICPDAEYKKQVIRACQTGDYSHRTIDKGLYKLSLDLLKKDPEWGDAHTKIMASLVNENRYRERTINQKKYELANAMAKGDYSVASIYSVVVLNNKNPELCK